MHANGAPAWHSSARRVQTHLGPEMWSRFPLFIVMGSATVVIAALYLTYRLVDPLPPRHFAIAAGTAGSGYDNFARQYARILARQGVELEIRNSVGAVENLNLLRDPASGVQAAITTFGFTNQSDADILSHLVEYSMQRYSFFTGTRSPLRNLRNSEASAFRSACRGLRYDHSSYRY